MGRDRRLNLLVAVELLDVDSLSHLVATDDRLLCVSLTRAELTHNAGLLKLPLELLEGPLDVLALLDGNYDHCFLLVNFRCLQKQCKVTKLSREKQVIS